MLFSLFSDWLCGVGSHFPMKDAYNEGGYEAGFSNCKAGVAERIIEEIGVLLSELKES